MRLAKKVGSGAIIAAGIAGVNALKCKLVYPAPPVFYDSPIVTGAGEPGEIVRVETIPWVLRTPAWRILYRSTDHRDKPTIVSGVLLAPAGSPPQDGWPVVAVAHGTAGLPRGAAPSLTIDANSDETAGTYAQSMKPFLDAGYAVAFTDYQGLGAPGEYSYLVGATEAANVLDSVRALRRFSEIPVSDRLFIWGHSQGGHAAAFAVERARDYAPELSIDGAVLVAPGAELRQIIDRILEQRNRTYLSILAMISIASWLRVYPELNKDDALKPLGSLLLGPSAEVFRMKYGALCCRLFTPQQLFRTNVLHTWQPYFDKNTPGHHPLGTPILIQQGDQDQVIPPSTNHAFAERLKRNGEQVTLQSWPDADHMTIVEPGLPAAIDWMAE